MSYSPKIRIPKSLTEGAYISQEQLMDVNDKSKSLYIGIPKAKAFQENRISLAPSSVKVLVAQGHHVMIESGAGEKSNFSDHDYSEAGAEIAYSPQSIYNANIILKVTPPTFEEMELFKEGQVIISPLHLPKLEENIIQKLRQKRVTAIAWEYIKDEAQIFPLVRILSEIAGTASVLTAAELLSNTSGGRGILLGGVTGVPSTKVIILGAGVVGESACRTALGLGADVKVFDNDIYKLMRLQHNIGRQINTSIINPFYLEQELTSTDVVIGAMHGETGRAPMIVSDAMVSKMKKGAVIIDVSIDQGGVFATSRMTSHTNPTFEVYDVIHYCVPNIGSKVASTSSAAISNVIMPIILEIAEHGGVDNKLANLNGLRHGVYTYKGCLTNQHIGELFGISSTDINLLITSRR